MDALWRIWTHPDVRRFLWDGLEIPRERAAAVVAECLALRERGLGLWTMFARGDPAVLGCAGLMPAIGAAEYIPYLRGAIEPVVALAPPHQGRGYATEALTVLVRHAFDTLACESLAAVIDVPNAGSHRLVERLGFVPVGEAAGPTHRLRGYRLDRPGIRDPGV